MKPDETPVACTMVVVEAHRRADGWTSVWDGDAAEIPPIEYTIKPGDVLTFYGLHPYGPFTAVRINNGPAVPYPKHPA